MTPDAVVRRQDRTDAYFGERSAYWNEIYTEGGVQGVVYRKRMQAALAWIDALDLDPRAKVLEVGCGAGLATLELARRGYAVHGTDSSAEMVALTSQRIADGGVSDVAVSVSDVHDLPHGGGSFELVLALGVLPWLHSPHRALAQIARVLAPGGHAILSADNRLRLNGLLDPVESPLFVPAKYARRAVRVLRGRPRTGAVTRLHTPGKVDRWLVAAGLEPERRTTVGFGPFTVFWRPVLPDRTALRLDRRLDQLAERRVPRLRCHGWHYLVSSRRASAR
jgi:2-polyprenyl-3-methyl-5-hydroxy-6-metoxy-1,4-benzoquinol methylase